MMTGRNNWQGFAQSVAGASHIRKGIPCQDASGAYLSEAGTYSIVAVADGHGDPTCVRSARGSAIAVEVTLQYLKEFAEYYVEAKSIKDNYPGENGYRSALRQLTNAIISRWYQVISEDLAKDPLTEEESELARPFAERFPNEAHIDHLYGTTLIAGLKAKGYMLLLQQGDGRCDLLYENGEFEKPLPEDERCFANITTSLSDIDAASRIRGDIIELKDKESIACFVGTDGLDNSIFDDEELLEFYLTTCLSVKDQAQGDVSGALEESLKNVSRDGNGDDVSLAGMYDKEKMEAFAQAKLSEIQKRKNDETIQWYRDKLSSMEGELETLRTKINNTPADNQADYVTEYLSHSKRYNEMKEKAETIKKTGDKG